MFSELHHLALQTPFTMMVTAEGELLTLTVLPRKDTRAASDDTNRAALAQPLQLTGTPDELATEFTGLLTTYRSSRTSLIEQLQVTEAVLKQAKDAAAKKATTPAATQKSTRTPVNQRPPEQQVELVASADDDTSDGDDETPDPPAGATATDPAPAKADDNFSLF